MSKYEKAILTIVVWLLMIVSVGFTQLYFKDNYSLQPKTTCFVMYTEQCVCQYAKAEVEYSIASNKGYYYCPNCQSSYEFSLDKHGNQITKGRDYE